jgi:thioredoxin-like negative regulator of GroEL
MKMAPDFETVASSFALEVRFLKVNTENDPELALAYGVNTLPTTIAFREGQEINRFSSVLGKMQLEMWAESLIQMQI